MEADKAAIIKNLRTVLLSATGKYEELPEIICFQELDKNTGFYFGELRRLGYNSVVHNQRTIAREKKYNGSLVAFRTEQFELVETAHLELNTLARG